MLFSVIIPVYNVEDYLRETLDSVINQTIGFKKNIEMILVNDGSPDNSEAICLEYRDRYPDNIKYIKKENGGVSSARNLGIEYATGKYVNFLDSDDCWEKHSFKNAYKFFEAHYDEIDVLAARIQFFEAKTNFHSLDYKFQDGSRIADLNDEKDYYFVQSTTATTFIRRDAIGDIRFDSQLKYGEDSTFINKIMLKKCKVGVIDNALYLYRRRATGDSAVNKQTLDKSFYTDSLTNYHMELFRYSEALYGKVIPYVQAMVSYDLLWRFANPDIYEALTDEEREEFTARAKRILEKIDDKIIINNPVHKRMTKRDEAFMVKYGKTFVSMLTLDKENGFLNYGDTTMFKIKRNKSRCCQVVKVIIEEGKIKIDLLIARWLLAATETGARLVIDFNEEEIVPVSEPYYATTSKTTEGEVPYYDHCYAEYPVDWLKPDASFTICPYLIFGEDKISLSMNYGKFVVNNNAMNGAYKFFGDYAVKCFRRSIKVFRPKNPAVTAEKWEKKLRDWLKHNGHKDAAKIREKFDKFKAKEAGKGKIWLISDRIDNAGDNGEVLFKYVCEHKPAGVRPMFVIGEMAKPEVKRRLESIGEVLYAEDKKYPYYFLLTDKIISSSAGEFTINPFEGNRPYVTDLMDYAYYFMNHGVNCGDCSKWLNLFNKNIHLFFTTGESERRNIIERGYNYAPEQVKITGLARFDALYDNPQKQLLILPTWRRAYKECYDDKTSSIYYEGFKDTDFFKFYNGLITDERLLKVMREKGYTGLFCLHPIFAKQAAHFENSDVFKINEGFVDYNKAFAESSLMVTDYSTIAFDFAYLNKPIVYTQFDKEEFYENQIYDECFDYENEGFGPVCDDLDSAVETLCRIIENDCQNEYQHRIDSFFVYHDKNNAKRITEAVLADDE